MSKFCCTSCGLNEKYLFEVEGFRTTAYAGLVCESCLADLKKLDYNLFINYLKQYGFNNDETAIGSERG